MADFCFLMITNRINFDYLFEIIGNTKVSVRDEKKKKKNWDDGATGERSEEMMYEAPGGFVRVFWPFFPVMTKCHDVQPTFALTCIMPRIFGDGVWPSLPWH